MKESDMKTMRGKAFTVGEKETHKGNFAKTALFNRFLRFLFYSAFEFHMRQ